MPSRAVFEAIEARRLFSFAAFDASYGSAGIAALNTATSGFGGSLSTNYDGGSIVRMANYDLRLQRVDAKGRTVTSFGDKGVFQLHFSAFGFAVDSRSGRFAIGFHDEPNNQSSEHGPDAIRFYNKNGKLERSVTATQVPGLTLDSAENSGIRPAFAFDAAGRLIIVSNGVVRRILPTGTVDTTFSSDGRVDLGGGTLEALAVGGASGNDIAVAIKTGVDFTGFEEGTRFTRTTTRLDAAGNFVTSFGTNGEFAESAGSTNRDTRTEYYHNEYQSLDGFRLLPDNSVLRLVYVGISRDFNTNDQGSETLNVSTLSAKGVRSTPVDLKASIGGKEDFNGTLAVDAAGQNAYVLVGKRIVKFDARTLALDSTFNGSDGAMNLQVNIRETSVAVDRSGRLLVVGSPLFRSMPTSILALSGSAGGVGGGKGPFTLLPNGVLDVAGTSGADSIRLRRVKTKLEVMVNGTSRRYNASDISSIVIHSGAGDDTIRADITGFYSGNLIIQAGKGNDRITGSVGADVIDAGDGDDIIDGHTGDDVIYAGRGNNTYL